MLVLAACTPIGGTPPAAQEAPAAEEAAEAEPEATEPVKEEDAAEEAGGDMMAGDAVAGQYIALITGGCGCHMNNDLGALAGGREFEGPFGVAYARNITPDPETGIGKWTAEEIVTALHTGAAPSRQLHPVMPYMRFSALSVKEANDVAAWLMSLEPVANEVPERELNEDPAPYTPATAPAAEPPTEPVARGAQLVALAGCAGCHTPKNEDGSPMADMMLAGAPLRDEFAANITPDEETGIGSWSEAEIATFLRTGTRSDGSQAKGAMEQQIDRRFSSLTEGDAAAIAAFLKTIPAVKNEAPAQ
jgi:mono/diheme cytochrome c family protein